jgi:uncharacterized protein (DUF1810 family)
MMTGPNQRFDLARFVEAQAGVYDQALAELRAGRKRSHWMWFIFPQLAGLGRSEMSRRYAISGLAEGRAYLEHPVLGARLMECAAAVLAVEGRSARQIMGEPDDMKLRSSMTLFRRAAEEESGMGMPRHALMCARVLEKYFAGEKDGETVRLLG